MVVPVEELDVGGTPVNSSDDSSHTYPGGSTVDYVESVVSYPDNKIAVYRIPQGVGQTKQNTMKALRQIKGKQTRNALLKGPAGLESIYQMLAAEINELVRDIQETEDIIAGYKATLAGDPEPQQLALLPNLIKTMSASIVDDKKQLKDLQNYQVTVQKALTNAMVAS